MDRVGSEDGNLLWFMVLKEKVVAKNDDKHCLMFILMAFSIFDLFLWGGGVVLHKE